MDAIYYHETLASPCGKKGELSLTGQSDLEVQIILAGEGTVCRFLLRGSTKVIWRAELMTKVKKKSNNFHGAVEAEGDQMVKSTATMGAAWHMLGLEPQKLSWACLGF